MRHYSHLGYSQGLLLFVGLLLMLAGCAHYEPFQAPSNREIPDGPGLFTGKSGELAVVNKGKLFPKRGSSESTAPAQTQPAEPPPQQHLPSSPAAGKTSVPL